MMARSRGEIAQSRKIEGKLYQLQDDQGRFSKKPMAQAYADRLRDRGFLVRVIQGGDDSWRLYARPAPIKKYDSMAAIRRQHQRGGGHWFDRDSMRFFKSRIESRKPIAGRFFVSSEQFQHARTGSQQGRMEQRRYTVRFTHPDGSIEAVGGFGAFGSRKDASQAAKRFAQERELRARGRF